MVDLFLVYGLLFFVKEGSCFLNHKPQTINDKQL